ncbi:MAG: metallophosphoesterase [Pantoea sp.]|uniref:metallophosphoesterase n=1 Tax=Pantoea sp. TaxID=69393 RepID=UPI0039E21AEA
MSFVHPLTEQQRHLLGEVSQFFQLPALRPELLNTTLRFGLMADPQYADVEADQEKNRYYRHALRKLPPIIAQLNQQPLDFVVTLGDMVDRHWEDYRALLPLYQQLQHPHAVVQGNHDALSLNDRLADVALPKSYYSFRLPGWRFVVYDGNDLSLYCSGEERQQAEAQLADLVANHQPQAQPWNGAVGEQQWQWIERQLQQAQTNDEQVIVFGHYPLAPHTTHILWNGTELAALFCRYRVRACFAGHDHRGGYARIDDTDFFTLKGLLDGAEAAPFAVVEISGDSLKVTGYGGEISR